MLDVDVYNLGRGKPKVDKGRGYENRYYLRTSFMNHPLLDLQRTLNRGVNNRENKTNYSLALSRSAYTCTYTCKGDRLDNHSNGRDVTK